MIDFEQHNTDANESYGPLSSRDVVMECLASSTPIELPYHLRERLRIAAEVVGVGAAGGFLVEGQKVIANGSVPKHPALLDWQANLSTLARTLGPEIQSQAKAFLESIEGERPPTPIFYPTESGGLTIEWIRPDRRLVIFFEPTQGDSGWTYVAKPSAGGDMRHGMLSEFRLDEFARLKG